MIWQKLMMAAGAAGAVPFATSTYTGTGSAQSIDNGLNLSADGGMAWIKERGAVNSHILVDTVRGVGKTLSSDSSAVEATDADTLTGFNTNGFDLGADVKVNNSSDTYVAWAFKEEEGFFDVLTYTGNGVSGLTVSHALGETPGMIIVKNTETARSWSVYHRSMDASPETCFMPLDGTSGKITVSSIWNDTAPDASEFTVGANLNVNGSGDVHAAYLFAHNPTNGIYCGSYTGTGATGNSVSLGWEPQFVMIKRADDLSDWTIIDAARDTSDPRNSYLVSNETDAEATGRALSFTATGFDVDDTGTEVNASGGTYIFLAVRA